MRDIPGPENAPVVLLLHGWTATADLNWHTSYEHLSKTFRVIAMDLRGHGRGVWANGGPLVALGGIRSIGRNRFSLSTCASDAAALLTQLNVAHATVVGFSMGGAVAQVMAKEHPQVVSGLVLCSTTSKFFPNSLKVQLVRVAMLASSPVIDSVPHCFLRALLEPLVRRKSAFVGEWAADELLPAKPAALIQAAAALRSFDSTSWVGNLPQPISLVVTEQDLSVPITSQRMLAQAIPTARIFSIDAGHDVWLRRPEEFARTLTLACKALLDAPSR